MNNELFTAVLAEEAPMYDAAVITEAGVEYWKSPVAHSLNNSHSVTKAFIAAGIGALRDDGLLSLDDPVTSFFAPKQLPEDMDPRWHKVTVRDTLQHRTGLENCGCSVDSDEANTVIGNDFLGHVFRIALPHAPGEYRQYSDEAYYLLSRIIAAVAEKPADKFLDERFFKPMQFGQWAMSRCPQGHPIGGGGLFARACDVAKLGYAYANGGVYDGKRLISAEWITLSMHNDFALGQFRDTDVYVKTGARGQMVAFSQARKAAAAWHGCAAPDDEGKRNDRLLEAFVRLLDQREKNA